MGMGHDTFGTMITEVFTEVETVSEKTYLLRSLCGSRLSY